MGGCGNNKGKGVSAHLRSAGNLLKHVRKCHRLRYEEVVHNILDNVTSRCQIRTMLNHVPKKFKKLEPYFKVMIVDGIYVSIIKIAICVSFALF